MNNPFPYCDVITTTTHKTLRGPRSALIFSKEKYSSAIDFAVFPQTHGGPHNNTIAGVAVALNESMTEEYKNYVSCVIENARALSEELMRLGVPIVTNGTDSHMMLVSLLPFDLTGSKMEKLLEFANITVNKNTIPGDKSALSPKGIRLGTPALTTRGLKGKEFKEIAHFIYEGIMIAKEIQKEKGKKLSAFISGFNECNRLKELKEKVRNFIKNYPLPWTYNKNF